MDKGRRDAFRAVGRASLTTALAGSFVASSLREADAAPPQPVAASSKDASLARDFDLADGLVHLNAAFSHPLAPPAAEALRTYAHDRETIDGIGPRINARNAAVAAFARLVNADPSEVVVVPSTLEAENLVGASLSIGRAYGDTSGVVTDALHYDASLALYGELSMRGMPLTVVAPKQGCVDMLDLEAAVAKQRPKLVAVSLVSSTSGFMYDLKALSDLAHRHGALVYVDVIQAAGAVPIDVAASGVDFCGCGGYKRLMGDFGAAFLYVQADRLAELRRTFVGWRQLQRYASHALPLEPPGPVRGDWQLKSDTVGRFEVGTPAWGPLAALSASIEYIHRLGVDAIVAHRQPLIDRLQASLPAKGFIPLTPKGSASPIAAFAFPGAAERFSGHLAAAKIRISTYPDRIRVSPSVFNSMHDVERLIDVLTA